MGEFANPDGYELWMGRWSARLAPAFVRFADLPEGDRFLDVGSGTGTLASALLEVVAGFAEILQADAGACPRAAQRPDPGAGYNRLYEPGRSRWPVTEALCWAHARRKFFVLADIAASAKKRATKKGKRDTVISVRIRGGAAHRRAVRHRAGDQWGERRRTARRPGRDIGTVARRSRGLDA